MTFLTACCRWQICRVRTEIVIHPRATCTRNVWPSVSQTTSSGTAAAETFICPVRKHYCCHSWIVNSMDLFEVVKVVKTLGLSPHSTRIDNNLGNLCDCNSKLFTDMIACRANCPFFILSEWVLFISPPPGGVCTMLLQQVGEGVWNGRRCGNQRDESNALPVIAESARVSRRRNRVNVRIKVVSIVDLALHVRYRFTSCIASC